MLAYDRSIMSECVLIVSVQVYIFVLGPYNDFLLSLSFSFLFFFSFFFLFFFWGVGGGVYRGDFLWLHDRDFLWTCRVSGRRCLFSRKELIENGDLPMAEDLKLGQLILSKFPKSAETFTHR